MATFFRLGSEQFKAFRPVKRAAGALFSISAGPSPDGKPRFSCVVSKKVSPKAVDRNAVKRRARAAVRGLGYVPPLAVVLTARRESARASYAEIRTDIEQLFSKIR